MNNIDICDDVYYSDDYIRLYLSPNDELFHFEYHEGDNIFFNKSIKRPICSIGDVTVDGYFDLESAYGYGGYYCNSDDDLFIRRAFDAYKVKCEGESIVAEFIRFHPLNTFPQKHGSFLDFNVYDRDVVVRQLSGDIMSSYKPKVRNIVRRFSAQVEFGVSENIERFIEIYAQTMKKNKADSFYFFNELFFRQLYSLKNIELYEIAFEGNVVAMGFFMFGKDLGHYHLSANTDASYKLNSNYVLLHHAFLLAQDKGMKCFILGGGTTSKSDDSLLMFKKKFSNDLYPFYISGNIFNRDVYNDYNKIWKKQSTKDVNYFLKYRLDIS